MEAGTRSDLGVAATVHTLVDGIGYAGGGERIARESHL